MKVRVETHDPAGKGPSSQKETDLDLPGNRRWLMSHIRWAARFNQVVAIRPY